MSLLWLPFRGATTYHVLRNGVSIYSGLLLSVIDSQGLAPGTQYEYEMFADFGSTVGTSSPRLVVTTLDVSASASESQCVGNTGVISELNYQPNSSKTWRIEPLRPFDVLTLRVCVDCTIAFYGHECVCIACSLGLTDISTLVR